MTKELLTKDYLLSHLNEALEQNQMKVYDQPIIRTLTSRVTSFLVTYAWDDPLYGMIKP